MSVFGVGVGVGQQKMRAPLKTKFWTILRVRDGKSVKFWVDPQVLVERKILNSP